MNLADTWAERILDFAPADGTEPSRIFVRLGRPHTEPGMGGAWRVEIEIEEGMEEPFESHSTGEDSFHVLELAMRHISILLQRWEDRGKLTWDGSDHLGFMRQQKQDALGEPE